MGEECASKEKEKVDEEKIESIHNMNKANGELSAQHGKVTDLTGSDSGDERPGSSSSGAARSSSLSKLNAVDVARSFKEYDMALKCNCKRGRKNGMKVVEHLHTCSLYDDDVIQSALYPTIENDNNLKSNPSNEPNGKEHPHESKEYENYFGRYKVDYDIREDLTNQESSQSGRERKKRDEDYTLIDVSGCYFSTIVFMYLLVYINKYIHIYIFVYRFFGCQVFVSLCLTVFHIFTKIYLSWK